MWLWWGDCKKARQGQGLLGCKEVDLHPLTCWEVWQEQTGENAKTTPEWDRTAHGDTHKG